MTSDIFSGIVTLQTSKGGGGEGGGGEGGGGEGGRGRWGEVVKHHFLGSERQAVMPFSTDRKSPKATRGVSCRD